MSDGYFLSITFLWSNARFSVKSLHLALKFCIFAVNKVTNKNPYTLLCFMGHDGHSLHIVCQYTIAAPVPEGNHKAQNFMLNAQSLTNAFRKLHFIYSSQLGTPLAEHEPTFETSCSDTALAGKPARPEYR